MRRIEASQPGYTLGQLVELAHADDAARKDYCDAALAIAQGTSQHISQQHFDHLIDRHWAARAAFRDACENVRQDQPPFAMLASP